MAGTLDITAERAATPGCEGIAHLNNAGAALPTGATLAAIVGHLELESERGGYEAAVLVRDALDGLADSAARLLGARAGEVVITGSDTQSWSKAVWGLALGGGLRAGQRVLVDRMAYDSHYLAVLQACELVGATVVVVPSIDDGTIDLGALAESLDDRVAFVSLTHVGTHRGLVNPAEEVGALCRRAGVPLFLDACQSAGQLPVDVAHIGCVVATVTGRKWLRGPRGTGLLYVDEEFAERLEPPGIDGHAAVWEDEGHYRLLPGCARLANFEVPVAAHMGLGVAIDHALDLGIDTIATRVDSLAEGLRRQLGALSGVDVHDGGSRRSGIVTFTVAGAAPALVVHTLAEAGINASYTEAPAARLDLAAPHPTSVVRASPHYYNTEAELDRLVGVVGALAAS